MCTEMTTGDILLSGRMWRAYVVSRRSAVNSVVSMVMFDVLRLMENFSLETNIHKFMK